MATTRSSRLLPLAALLTASAVAVPVLPAAAASGGAGGGIVTTAATLSATTAPAAVGEARGVIVTWAPTTSKAKRRDVLADRGLSGTELPGLGAAAVDVPAGTDAAALARQLGAAPGVASAEPDSRVRALGNDPFSGQQWGLHNVGQSIDGSAGTPDVDVDAPEAWAALPATTKDVVVAVIDTGTQVDHPDLAGRIWTNPGETPGNGVDDDANGYVDDVNGWDFVHGDGTVYDAADGDGHGTHVSGTIAAAANNGQGGAGVAPNAKVMVLKALGGDGTGSTSDVAAAVAYAVANGATVVNMSLGGPDRSATLERAIRDAGVTVVAAAGNSGNDLTVTPEYPGALDLPNLLTVAAVDNRGSLATFSNRGGSTDLAAPGQKILSTYPTGRYAWSDGTSMATPHASGVAALVGGVAPRLSGTEVVETLVDTAVTRSSLSGVTRSGGMLNAADAVTAAIAGSAAPAPEPEREPVEEPTPEPVLEVPAPDGDAPGPKPAPDPARDPAPQDPTGAACPVPLGMPFTDVSEAGTHSRSVACAAALGLIRGTGGGDTYNPGGQVNRGQMAAFLARLLRSADVPLDGSTSAFDDVAGNVFADDANALAAVGVVAGVGDRRYDPAAPVSREQMATFLVRAYELVEGSLPDAPDAFRDDDGSAHEKNIDKARAAGFASGTGPTTYGPRGTVSRAQMASFLVRVLDRLAAYGVVTPLS